MKNTQFFDLLNGIDDTLLTDALNPSPQPSKTVVLKRFTAAACVCLILSAGTAIALVLPGSNNTPPSSSSFPNTPSQNNPSPNIPFTDPDISTNVPLPTIEKHYRPEFSFVRGKFKNIIGNYQEFPNAPFHLLFIEFEVIEEFVDYYNRVQPGETFLVPLLITKITKEDIIQLIAQNDEFVLYITGSYYEYDWFYDAQTETAVKIHNPTSKITFTERDLIPIKNNTVNLEQVYQLMDMRGVSYLNEKYILGFSDYIADGMTVSQLRENIQKLYQKMIENKNTEEKNTDTYLSE